MLKITALLETLLPEARIRPLLLGAHKPYHPA
jgi:hypothetical protein